MLLDPRSEAITTRAVFEKAPCVKWRASTGPIDPQRISCGRVAMSAGQTSFGKSLCRSSDGGAPVCRCESDYEVETSRVGGILTRRNDESMIEKIAADRRCSVVPRQLSGCCRLAPRVLLIDPPLGLVQQLWHSTRVSRLQ